MPETMEDRLIKYNELKIEKKSDAICPVCFKSFVNNYSLSNHFLIRGYNGGPQYIDEAHKDYYLRQKAKKKSKHIEEVKNRLYIKKCIRCGREHQTNYEHRFQKRCPECELIYPVKIKRHTNLIKNGYCTRCNSEMIIKLYSTTQVCVECRKKEREEKIEKIMAMPLKVKCLHCKTEFIYYKKHIKDHVARILCEECKKDPCPFKKDLKYENVIYLLKSTTLTRREIKALLGLERDFIREAAIERYGEVWYKERVRAIRTRAILQTCFCKPSGLEKRFASNLIIPFIQNKWMNIELFGKLKRCEIDIEITLSDKKIAIFIDGETFHGPNSYFRSDPYFLKRDIAVAETLANNGYYAIRYSETEINKGHAIAHFNALYLKFIEKPPFYYCRNWMTNEEIIRY